MNYQLNEYIAQIKEQLQVRSVQDPQFRDRLIADPQAVLAENSFEIPSEIEISVVEETPRDYYLVIPASTVEQIDSIFRDRTSETEKELIKKAVEDGEFRDRLIATPKAVLAEFGLEIPAEVQITVKEETASHYYVVLPWVELLELKGIQELGDRELEAVAGGAAENPILWLDRMWFRTIWLYCCDVPSLLLLVPNVYRVI